MNHIETAAVSARIYRRQAEVLRRGETDLAPGTATVYLSGISASADRETVRLFTSEPCRCTRFRFLSEREMETISETEAIEDEILFLQQENEVRNDQIELWKENGIFTSREEIAVSEISAWIEALPERIIGLRKEIRETEKKIRKLQEKLEMVRAKESGPVLAAELFTETDAHCVIELRYQETAAGWSPFYEIHTDAKEPLEIRMRAELHQTSGEDWENIAVSLFTGNPSFDGQLPEVRPVFLDLLEPVPVLRSNAMMGKMAGAALEDTMGISAPMMAMAVMEEAEVNEEETMSEYILPGTYRVPNEAAGILADLQSFTVPADYRIAAAPRKDPCAYLTALIKTADLPPRKIFRAKVYLKDINIGTATLDPDYSEDTVTLSLGKEERVHVSFREVRKKTSTALLKGQKITEYEYETAVSADRELTIVLTDQIPVSRNKAITVDPISLSGAELNSETGILTKEMTLAPKESKTWRFSYKVSRPKDKEIRETVSSVPFVKYCPNCGAPIRGGFCSECGYSGR